jgi:thiamine biosynthesis lipoprotein
MNRRRFLAVLGGAGGLAALGATALAPRGLARTERRSRALGAQVSISALHEDRRVADAAIADAFAELERVEAVMSLYRPESQLSRLNREGALPDPHPYLVEVLHSARALSERTDGAFDVTVQPLWALAGDPEAAARALPLVDWRGVSIAPGRVSLRPGQAVTLNGIAQGYAADRVRAALLARGIRHALVDTGELGASGRKEDGAPWTVGIQHPRRPDAYVALAALEDRFLSTSGDYATAFSADFRRHHIVDPRTGSSPAEFSSVSVLARTGMEADALSTAVFVLGLERALELIRSTPGAEALLVLKDGTMRQTPGFPRLT